jgi:hypothetical protein
MIRETEYTRGRVAKVGDTPVDIAALQAIYESKGDGGTAL